jgi:hypothetical protein
MKVAAATLPRAGPAPDGEATKRRSVPVAAGAVRNFRAWVR